MQKFPMILAGRSLTPNQDLVVTDKYLREKIASCPMASPDHFDTAIESAWRSRTVVQRIPASERKRILMHCVERIRQLSDDFVGALVREAGKPIRAARLEVERCIETLSLSAEEAVRLGGSVLPMDGSARGNGYIGLTRRFPVGVCGLITPFNFPLNLVAHKVGPAIAAGCPFVLKPASSTPMCALMLGDILIESGLPPESFSILPATRNSASALVTDDRIAMLSFTGSDTVGWQLKQQCGRKRICLELGGNAVCIVDQGFPWRSILNKLVAAAFGQSGQSCISLQRLMIHRSDFDSMIAELVRLAKAVRSGDPRQEDTLVGPMIDDAEADRILNWIEQAKMAGARVLLAATRMPGTSVVTPAILADVPEEQPLCQKEAFGPVLVVEPFDNLADALDRVNRSKYGLQTGIFTDHIAHAWSAWETLEVGSVVVGDTPNLRFDSMPYGGVKASGIGREGVRYAIDEMTHERLLLWKTRSE
ncbi:MAG: aldehyde dehydrogenase family protein [Pirellula sp.]